MDFKISVVMATYNAEEYIAESIESVINQSLDFKRYIQLIIVNDASTDNTLNIADYYQRKYPRNITVVNVSENQGAAHSRNVGLKYVRGEYVNFLDSDDYITEYTFAKALKMLEANRDIDIVSIPIYFFGARRGGHILNFKYAKKQIVNLFEKPEYIQLSGASSFFRFSKLKNYEFNEKLKVSEDPLLINQMLLDNPKMGFLNDCGYYYRKHDTTKSLTGSSFYNKSYYTSRIDEYFIKLIKCSLEKYGKVPKFIQHLLMYDLQWIFRVGHVDMHLSMDEIMELYRKLIFILSYIDDDVIIYQKEIPGKLKAHIILLKRHGLNYVNDKLCAPKTPLSLVGLLNLDTVHIDICQVKNGELYILGYVTTFTINPSIRVVINGSEEIHVNGLSFPQRDNYSLNFNYGFNNHFDVSIPINNINKIEFRTDELSLKIDYSRTSRLSRMSGYLLSKNYLIINHDNHISVIPRTLKDTLLQEVKTLKRILSTKEDGWRTGILLRIAYFLTYPIYNQRRIWIFMDLPYMAQDNSFQLFKYVTSAPLLNIDKYFAIEKKEHSVNDVEVMANKYVSSSKMSKLKSLLGLGQSSEEYRKVEEIGFALPYRSLRHRLYSLFAEVVVSSNPENRIIYPFWGNFPHVAGLVRSKTVFLQHGVTKDDTSGWLNKYDKNLDLIVTVSEAERESFLTYDYGYDESIVKVLGFPRFDNLVKLGDMQEIVVMPTWRKQYDNLRPSEFIKTDFFKAFNKLLSDSELISFLESEGYYMVFKPHPNLKKFMFLFNKHPKVDFDDRSYEEIFNHSSLLVTDYSSVYFDFAYLKKPLIYYHYGDDYHFDVDGGYFKYESMGFGPIAHTYEELKNDIISMVIRDCRTDEVYSKRADEFFRYHDKNNSRRVFDAILDIDFDY